MEPYPDNTRSTHHTSPDTSQAILPVTQERLIEICESRGWSYFIDNVGDLGGTFDDNQFFFMLRGEQQHILYIQATWHHSISIDSLDTVRQFIDNWHRQHLWPKAFYRITDEGVIRVQIENAFDCGAGMTDQQLLLQMECVLSTGIQLFTQLHRVLTGGSDGNVI